MSRGQTRNGVKKVGETPRSTTFSDCYASFKRLVVYKERGILSCVLQMFLLPETCCIYCLASFPVNPRSWSLHHKLPLGYSYSDTALTKSVLKFKSLDIMMETKGLAVEANPQSGGDTTLDSSHRRPDPLCNRCTSIDLDMLLSQAYNHTDTVPLLELERLPENDCSLCRLFTQYCGDSDDRGHAELLCSVSSLDSRREAQDSVLGPGYSLPLDNTRMLSALPITNPEAVRDVPRIFFHKRGYIGEPSSTPLCGSRVHIITPRSVDPKAIDFSLLRGWLMHCQDCRGFCEPSEVRSTWAIRLIDCETCLIIEATHIRSPYPPFLALVMFEGPQAATAAHQNHCKPPPSRFDASRGPLRTAWLSRVKLKARTFVWVWGSGSIRKEIISLTWSTRGRMYQEGLFTPRRLVFTDRQVYFQCDMSVFYENYNIPENFQDWNWSDTIFARVEDSQSSWAVGDRICEYTLRNLGNQADILNAIQGIFDHLSREASPVYNI